MNERTSPLFAVPPVPPTCSDPFCLRFLALLAPLGASYLKCEHGQDAESQKPSPAAAA